MEGESEEEEEKGLMMIGEKLSRGGNLLGKMEGNCSTPPPTWDFGSIQPDGSLIQRYSTDTVANTSLSARKLGANLWEVHPLLNTSRPDRMNGRKLLKKDDDDDDAPEMINDTDLRKKIPASLRQHNQRVKNIGQAQQPLSPASYCSSMEKGRHSHTMSPANSVGSKGKIRESNYSLKTSAELLKVLNRIWSLEEKHALDMSLVKMLKKELDQSQTQIKELLQEQKRDLKQIDNLMKQITEDKVTRNKKEHDRIKIAVKSMKEELADERNISWQSEKLCHKLAQELSETKSSYSYALRELERETRARRLREDLCDEFAKGVIDCVQEIRLMKHKSGDYIGKEDHDRLILHMSEEWLDERMQMKLADVEKPSAVDKLSSEIETFLLDKQSRSTSDGKFLNKHSASGSKLPMHYLESLNEPGSAPWNWKDEDDSVGTAIHNPLFHRDAQSEDGVFTKQQEQGRPGSLLKETKLTPRKKRVQSDEHVEDKKTRSVAEESRKLSTGSLYIKPLEVYHRHHHHMEGSFDTSIFAGPISPVKNWNSEITPADPDLSWSCSSVARPNTLQAKLLEARLEGQQSRARTSRGALQAVQSAT